MRRILDLVRRYLVGWLVARGWYVFVLWSLIGIVGFCISKVLKPEPRQDILGKLHDFADIWLVASMTLGAVLFLGLSSLLFRAEFQKLRGDVADEVCGAATNFAAISLILFLWDCVAGSPNFLNLAVVAGMVLGAVLTYEPGEASQDLGIKITSPSDGAKVAESMDVKGTAARAVPSGKELWLIRRWVIGGTNGIPWNESILQKAPTGLGSFGVSRRLLPEVIRVTRACSRFGLSAWKVSVSSSSIKNGIRPRRPVSRLNPSRAKLAI